MPNDGLIVADARTHIYAASQSTPNILQHPVPPIAIGEFEQFRFGLDIPQLDLPRQLQHSRSASEGFRPSEQSIVQDSVDTVDYSDIVNYDQIKLWIDECTEQHDSTCMQPELETALLHTEVEIILIDVQQNCLVEATTSSRYLALSYVWGSVTQLQCSTQIFRSLKEPQSLVQHKAQIPRVILDAIHLVSSIGETYLWVDSLCINQDDVDSKHHQIAHMSTIYNKSLLTIAAVSCRDASSHLPGISPGTRWQKGWKSSETYLNRPLRPDLVQKTIARSHYVSRGWTFQERHLSRRCLYFLDEQMYFQCRSELWCEEPPLIVGTDLARFHMEPKSLDMGLSFMSRTPEWSKSIQKKDWDRAFAFYADLVSEYSCKQLSFPHDVMNAFSGVLRTLEHYSGWNFAYGLPEPLIDYALMWIPKGTCERRPLGPPGPNRYFPSWSWAGWVGAITFDLIYDSELAAIGLAVVVWDIKVHDAHDKTFHELRRCVGGKKIPKFGNWNPDYIVFPSSKDDSVEPPPHFGSVLQFKALTQSARIVDWTSRSPQRTNFRSYQDTFTIGRTFGKGCETGLWLFEKATGQACGVLHATGVEPYLSADRWAHFKLVLLSLSYLPPCIPLDDEDERTNYYSCWPNGSEWKVCNFLLVESNGVTYERVALGQMSRDVWDSSEASEEIIWLS